MHRRAQRAREDPRPGTTGAAESAPSPRASRRQLLRGAGALAALGTVGVGSLTVERLAASGVDPRTVIPLWSQTVAYDASAQRVLVGARSSPLELSPGTRCAAALPASSPVRDRAAAFEEGTAAWRARLGERFARDSSLPDLGRTALADLWILSDALPAPVAGWSRSWRYVWPRDAAFCAVALARAGHPQRAAEVLGHLQSLQAADGWFEARYEPGTAHAPDGRARQFDGTGLALWACAEVLDAAADTRRAALRERLDPLITTSLAALRTSTREGTGLPPVSPDYWERPEDSVTLWIMASTLAGLRAGAVLTEDPDTLRAVGTFTLLLEGTFGPTGYQRYRGGGGADSALALFAATGTPSPVPPARLRALRDVLARPGGGIAPGAAWPEDGVTWTPSTSLLALGLARSGEHEAAVEMLRHLAAHRTAAGSLPEKLLFDGRPAEVAPLAWTAANVLLTLDELARG